VEGCAVRLQQFDLWGAGASGPGEQPRVTAPEPHVTRYPAVTRFQHRLPEVLTHAFEHARWPNGVISARRFTTVPHLAAAGVDIELTATIAKIAQDNADISGLEQFARHQDKWKVSWKLVYGSDSERPPQLPWLDLEKAVAIGGGADYGDDTWILLDYRTDVTDPRVVCNEFVHVRDGTRDPVLTDFRWLELAPTLSEFLRLAGAEPA
jgi:hypothetical protein